VTQRKPRLLVVDDDVALAASYCEILDKYGYEATRAASGEEAHELIQEYFFDLLILDQRMQGMSGTDLLEACQQRYPGIGAIFISGCADQDAERKAAGLGSLKFLHKGSITTEELLSWIRCGLDDTQIAREARRGEYAARGRETFTDVIGESPAVKQAIEQARAMSRSNAPVLLLGETGTGKELFARAIHNESKRRDSPFVTVNAATIPSELAESFLFGHRKGAFTGAVENREGCFQAAHTGTLFLDEVGDLSSGCHPKLLRVLQEGKFTRLGDSESKAVAVDVRVITATNKNLEERSQVGIFPADLYYRLAVLPIRLPPLRERGEDIAILTMHFLFRYSAEEGKHIKRIAPEAVEKLKCYSWPGNIRELANVLRRTILLAEGDIINAKDIYGIDRGSLVQQSPGFADLPFNEAEKEFERQYFEELLARTDRNITMVAKKADLDRSTVYNYLNKLGISLKSNI
jgi:DNA-binding NtrC family response regulator